MGLLRKDYIHEQLLKKMAEFSLERGNQLLKDGLTNAEANATVQAEVNDKFSESAIVQFIEDTADGWVAKAFSDMDDKLTSSNASMQSFLQHNSMLWRDGFDKSEMLYLMILEMSDHYQAYYLDLSDKTHNALKNRYYVLRKLHGRACQQFYEILWLLRGGFAGGAYARWRSLFELSVIAEFISQNDEQVAKAFVDSVKTNEVKDYGWAKNAQCFASLKPKASVTFEMIRSQCTTITEDWKKAYKESCQVVHASPLGTLGRMGSPNENRVISTGSSDYGLAPPAVNSAISLMHVTLFYFGLLSQMDSRAMIRTIQKWLDNLIDCYTSINSRSFSLEEISDNLPQTYE